MPDLQDGAEDFKLWLPEDESFAQARQLLDSEKVGPAMNLLNSDSHSPELQHCNILWDKEFAAFTLP